MKIDQIVKNIQTGPTVLFVGQAYLSLQTGQNPVFRKLADKFKVDDGSNSYDILFKAISNANYETVAPWLNELSKVISVPAWLENIGRLPWSSVFTSAIEPIVQRSFWAEWRKIQPVYDERFGVFESRNKFLLHVNHLYGCVSQTDYSQRPPTSLLEKARRKQVVNNFLLRLPTTVTPMGTLVVDGYNQTDWLNTEDLYGAIAKFGKGQVLFFSATSAMQDDIYLRELSNEGILTFFTESFSEFITGLELEGKLKFFIPEEEEYYGKWISINDKKVKIPQERLTGISRVATVIEEGIFETPDIKSEEEKYLRFKLFLSSTSTMPEWSGYTMDFAFKRDFYENLWNNVQDKIKSNANRETPVILTGQSSSGKTVALGNLAYDLFVEKAYPVLFIEKRFQKIDLHIIDEYCRWVEENGATCTVVIWDGMMDAGMYESFLKRLNTRGRNIVLVGSSYDTGEMGTPKRDLVVCPIDLTGLEKKRFVEFLQSVEPGLSNIISGLNESNFLAMLYRHLPGTRAKINQGLHAEFNFFAKILREAKDETIEPRKNIFKILIEAGVFENSDETIFTEQAQVEGELTNLADLIIYLVMVPGQFGLSVPFELLMRIIGYESISSSVFRIIEKIKLIRWSDDPQGNILLGPRIAIEAQILVRYLGPTDAQAYYILTLIEKIQSFDFLQHESSPEVQFAVELLNYVSPNETNKYKNYWYKITEILKDLRENRIAYHPRLVLKEASFLRELAKDSAIDLPEPKLRLLSRAEQILRDMLNELSEYQERTITTFLRIELASNLGTQARTLHEAGAGKSAVIAAYEGVKSINTSAFAMNPDNYHALDVLAWATEYLIRSEVFSQEEKMNAEVDMMNLFDLAEMEGVSFDNLEDFNRRKLSFYSLIGKQDIAESVFNEMAAHGFTEGYYFRARKFLTNTVSKDGKYTDGQILAYQQVVSYLDQNFNAIKSDGRCIYLLLRSWWITKLKSDWFSGEKQSLPLTEADWEYCYDLVYTLLLESSVYNSPSLLYIKAIAEFHLEMIDECLETFRTLGDATDFSAVGKRRIIKSYIASDLSGKPELFSGYVNKNISYLSGKRSGELFVPVLGMAIHFNTYEFGKNSFQKDEVIDRFYIGFNFRGPIAVPFNQVK